MLMLVQMYAQVVNYAPKKTASQQIFFGFISARKSNEFMSIFAQRLDSLFSLVLWLGFFILLWFFDAKAFSLNPKTHTHSSSELNERMLKRGFSCNRTNRALFLVFVRSSERKMLVSRRRIKRKCALII